MAVSQWIVRESRLVNQSTMARAVNNGQIIYFTLFVAVGSSTETLNGLARKR